MTKFSFDTTLATHVVASRKVNVEIDLSKISADIAMKLMLHGLTQKVSDSAASAMADAGLKGLKFDELPTEDQGKVQDFARKAMLATIESLIAGEWSERVAGESVNPVVARIRVKFGALLRDKAKAKWAEIKDADDKGERLDALFATQPEATQAALTKLAKAELAAEAKSKAEAKAMNVEITI